MKRIILGMSFDRKKVIERLDSYSKNILIHVCECVVYKNSLGCLDHWIDELATWFDNINRMTVSGNKKLKSADYAKHLFGEFGTSWIDCKINLDMYMFENVRHGTEYPKVEITDEMCSDLFDISTGLVDKMCKVLSTHNDLTKYDFRSMLEKLMKQER